MIKYDEDHIFTEDELRELEGIVFGAHRGPWAVRPDMDDDPKARPQTTAADLHDCNLLFAAPVNAKDALFIAHARYAVPALIRALRAARDTTPKANCSGAIYGAHGGKCSRCGRPNPGFVAERPLPDFIGSGPLVCGDC